MTIKPADMQVLLTQTGQASRMQRGLQNQQQTEQQILGQMIHKELKNIDNIVQKTEHSVYKKIEDEEKGKNRQSCKNKKKRKSDQADNETGHLGSIFDIKA